MLKPVQSPSSEASLINRPPSRRGFFFGAAAVGAAAAAVVVLPQGEPVAATALPTLPPAPENGGGYSLSAHVQRYYQTTRI